MPGFVASACQMLLKIYALRLTGMDSYVADQWNRLDGTLVVMGWVDLMPVQFINLTVFRLSRALRALRMLSHNEQMKIFLASMAAAAVQSLQTLMLLAFITILFTIIAVQVLLPLRAYVLASSAPRLLSALRAHSARFAS